MFFRLPVVRFFNRVINRATVTVALVLLQIGWLLWAFFSLTAGKVWVNAGLNVLSLFITLYLVRKDENSDYKIIWLVLIGMMPLLGGALYLAFGNKAPAKRMRQRMQAVERQHTADLAQQPGQTDALDPASRGLSRYVSEYGPYPAWKNSTAKYYPCGEAMYPDLLADLEKAERFIFLEFFIVRTGKMWKGVEDILVRKAAQGVDVRLIYDDFGSLLGLPSDFVVKMERAHIRCIPFNPVVPLVSLVMNHRDHRKIVVVDGNTAYTGGINLADEYINEEERFGYWKDAALRTEGAAVWNFTVMFLDHWNAFRPSERIMHPLCLRLSPCLPSRTGNYSPTGGQPAGRRLWQGGLPEYQSGPAVCLYLYALLRGGRDHAGSPQGGGKAGRGRPAGAAGHPGQARLPADPLLLCAAAPGGGAHLRVHARLPPRQVLRQR